ncbi:MAG: hypothetical protein M0R70_08450 [Nitrospirae bacterium]|nr:hypothetical protein [Nitrospirota bacterium]
MKIVMAKGVNFLFARKYIENKYSPETWGRIMHSLSDDSKTVWTSVLLAGSEYPFAAFKEMITSLNKELKTAKDPEIAAIYEYIADQSLSKTYKIFFKFANPSFVIKNYPKLWSMFFNSGTVEVQVAESGHAVLKFLLPEIFNDWLPPACLGYSKKAVEMAGGRNLLMKKNSAMKTSEDLWETVYELRWME